MKRQTVAKTPKISSRNNHFQKKSARVTTHPLMQLQRSIGNTAIQRLINLPSNVQILRQQGTGGLGNQPPAQPIGGVFFCNKALFDTTQIDRAVDTAKMWMGTAIPILNIFKMRGLSDDRVAAVRVALRANFNITDPFPSISLLGNPLETILQNMIKIDQALNQPLQFHCTNACFTGDLAFVFGNPQTLSLPAGIINICPGFFGCDPLKQASTIIHERAHEALGAQDHAYEGRGLYDSLPTVMALENAESYAVFARQLFHNGIQGPGLTCSAANLRIPDLPNLQLPPSTLQMPRRPRPTLTPRP